MKFGVKTKKKQFSFWSVPSLNYDVKSVKFFSRVLNLPRQINEVFLIYHANMIRCSKFQSRAPCMTFVLR